VQYPKGRLQKTKKPTKELNEKGMEGESRGGVEKGLRDG